MCGIAGKIDWNASPGTDAVVRMCEKLRHRGPDDYGITELENITLGHRRLSIIDLSAGARQPMASSDGRYFIVYNGEVYNFKELKKELEGEGAIFKTSSDTEVILYSYIHWKERCLERFNGMFALAIWDKKTKGLFMARDRFGKKPLYYYKDREKMMFASELSALICDPEIPRELSYEALNSYLALGYILAPMTLYKDIFKLECATYMLVTDAGKTVKKARYWDYAEKFGNKIKAGEKEIAGRLLGLLDASVKRRMVSDVPIGAFLSGGLDSSSVSALMRKYHRGQLHTFSIGFDQESYSEIEDAGRAAKWIGTIHHNQVCASKDSPGLIREALESYDEPFADNSCIPTYALAKLTSAHVKVALSGDGADELLAGYMTYKADRYYYFARRLPLSLRRFLARPLDAGRRRRAKLDFGYRRKQFFHGSMYSPEKAHYLWRIIFHPEERVAILGEDKRDLVYDTDPFLIFEKYYARVPGLHWLDRNLYVDAMTWLTDDILVKVDRASMKNSIEVRNPYLDVELAGYCASIPAELKMKGLKTKYILKAALKGVLPGFILDKKKSGFNAPVGAWLGLEENDEFRSFNKFVFDRKMKDRELTKEGGL